MAGRFTTKNALPIASLELIRDIYGFTVRPQHLQRYREYADIYKEEEAERCERWDQFLDLHVEFRAFQDNSDGGPYSEGVSKGEGKDEHLQEAPTPKEGGMGKKSGGEGAWKVDTWGEIRPSLWPVEGAMCIRIKKRSLPSPPILAQKSSDLSSELATLPRIISSPRKYASEDDSDEEFYDVERSESVHDGSSQPETPVSSSTQMVSDAFTKDSCPWKDELEALVRGGVPMAFRGELWQVFVGTRTRRVQGHYDALLMLLADGGGESDGIGGLVSAGNTSFYSLSADSRILEKWTSQIEKDLPRTFPGHPALDENGRNALRRLLTAYARHNPDVGYCQAMNFFAALLLLLMPEENAFWTLAGIIDDYFEGYYSEKMVEAQVDQLVFEDLIREYFPRLANHLDSLGVQVAWVSGPWFLSIFVNVLPWECVLRVWDVLLYEGNRSMLFRTALALMDLHGPAIMATKDAGDAVTLLQSSAGATFDSSQLVLTACMGYQMVDEARLQELRAKHRPNVLASLQERSMGLQVFHDSHKGASAELGKAGTVNNTDHNLVVEDHAGIQGDSVKKLTSDSSHLNGFAANIAADGSSLSSEESTLLNSSNIGSNGFHSVEEGSAIDLGEQVKWLKNELCRVLEENRVATLRAEELQTAFVELVKQDNRRLLTAKIEALEEEVTELKKKLADKEEQEQAMVEVMLRMEQEQALAEEARRYAETDAAAQRNNAEILQKKYEDLISEIAAMENRAIMAESMLEATLQYQALGPGQVSSPKVSSETSRFGDEELAKSSRSRIPFSPRKDSADSSKGLTRQDTVQTSKEVGRPKESQPQSVDPSQKNVVRSRSFALGWLDRTKAKTAVGDVQNGLPVTPISAQNGLETVIEDDTNKANGMLINGKYL